MPIRTEGALGLAHQYYANKCHTVSKKARNSAQLGNTGHYCVEVVMTEKLLFRVAKSFSLPGLGILLLPETASLALSEPARHTHLRLTLRYPGGHELRTVASVEEITRPDAPETRALLLTAPDAQPVPAGTEVWWDSEQEPGEW